MRAAAEALVRAAMEEVWAAAEVSPMAEKKKRKLEGSELVGSDYHEEWKEQKNATLSIDVYRGLK
jgi:hypothetical protein